jgi:hypothetical protein
VGGEAIAQLQVEGIEELPLEFLGQSGEVGQLIKEYLVLLWLGLLSQRSEILGLGLPSPGEFRVAPLEPVAEVSTDLLVPVGA